MRPFQDYIQHHLVQQAIEWTWRSRFTPAARSSQGAQVANTRPSHLVDLFYNTLAPASTCYTAAFRTQVSWAR